MGRLLRGTFKLAVIAAVIGGLAALGKKLMGGLGPTPGSADAPREWPSLVPEPSAETEPSPGSSASNNGAEPVTTAAPTPAPGADDPAVTDVESDPTP